MADSKMKLGDQLRAARAERGLSLRDVERASGVNSGYLSQLERNEIASPSPNTLGKLASAYGEPVGVLMTWAGYAEPGLSPNAQRALHVLGDNFSDEELTVLKAVLDAIRSRDQASFSEPHATDRTLSAQDQQAIRASALALLREIEADRHARPVDLKEAFRVAKLVRAGDIELTIEEKRSLRRRFGSLVDTALRLLQGVVHLDSGAVYVQPGLHELKRRFVLAHEIGHAVLPDHRVVFAHLDDKTRLTPDFNDLLERQANQFAIELLAKGDRLRAEFDDSSPRASLIGDLADKYRISRQAAARRLAEESRQEIAVALSFRASGGRGQLMPPKIYCSRSFEERMRWHTASAGQQIARDSVRAVALGTEPLPTSTKDARGSAVRVRIEGLDAFYAVIVLLHCEPGRPALLRGLPAFLKSA